MLTSLLAAVVLAPAPFTFAVYGDCRDGHAAHRQVVAQIVKQKPSLVFNTGDLVRKGTESSLWAIFDEIVQPLRAATDLYAVRGNHDYGDGGFERRFAKPESDSKTPWFSFDRNGCHFVGLYVEGHSEYKPGTDQYKWLEADLKASKAAHKFVFFHTPPYSIGAHFSDLEVRKALCPLFEKYKVDVVFNGHEHNYYRTVRNGVTYLVTGGGGAPLYTQDPAKGGAIEGDKWEKVNHFVSVTVEGAQVTLRALRPDGTAIETITATPSGLM